MEKYQIIKRAELKTAVVKRHFQLSVPFEMNPLYILDFIKTYSKLPVMMNSQTFATK